jgi:hypothetical protein
MAWTTREGCDMVVCQWRTRIGHFWRLIIGPLGVGDEPHFVGAFLDRGRAWRVSPAPCRAGVQGLPELGVAAHPVAAAATSPPCCWVIRGSAMFTPDNGGQLAPTSGVRRQQLIAPLQGGLRRRFRWLPLPQRPRAMRCLRPIHPSHGHPGPGLPVSSSSRRASRPGARQEARPPYERLHARRPQGLRDVSHALEGRVVPQVDHRAVARTCPRRGAWSRAFRWR